jgi:hypothetical protein
VTRVILSNLSAKQNEAVTGDSSPSASAGVGGSPKGNLRAPVAVSDTRYKVVGQHELVGQFRPAGGLVLPSGRGWAPQTSCRSLFARLHIPSL